MCKWQLLLSKLLSLKLQRIWCKFYIHFLDLGWKLRPRGSKIELLEGHIWAQGWFSDHSPTSCAPNGSFFLVFEWIFGDFLDDFLMTFWISTFYEKKHDFLKVMLSSRREHHFWRTGADLESPRSAQNEQKVISGGYKKAMLINNRKSKKNLKFSETRTLTKHCIYCTDLMFCFSYLLKLIENWESKKEVFWGPESTFSLQKGPQTEDFFERCGSEFRLEKTMVCSTLGLP